MIGALRYFAERLWARTYWPKGANVAPPAPRVTAVSAAYTGAVSVSGSHEPVFAVRGWQGSIAVSGCVEEG